MCSSLLAKAYEDLSWDSIFFFSSGAQKWVKYISQCVTLLSLAEGSGVPCTPVISPFHSHSLNPRMLVALLVSWPDSVCFASSGFTCGCLLVAVFWRLPWGHWHCLFQHRELEVPGVDVLGWGRGRRASRAVAVGCRSMNLSFSASHRDESWGIKYIPELPAGLGQRHSFQGLAPDFILSSCWWLALLTAKSFF